MSGDFVSIRVLTDKFKKIIQPKSKQDYVYQLKDGCLDFNRGVDLLRERLNNPIAIGSVDNTDPNDINAIRAALLSLGIAVNNFEVNVVDYQAYVEAAQYKTKYPHYYKDNFYEKSLEHFLCYQLLNLKQGDIFIDIASESSPVSAIFASLSDCVSYSQDIMYEPGVHNMQIGSNASDIPVADESFSAAIATCSIEHFENESDINFMREMGRILKKNGKIIIVPLYLHTTPSCQTDPTYSVPGDVVFDEEVEICCAKGWGNRHGRFYSPETLVARLLEGNNNIEFLVHFLKNPREIDDSVYCRYILEGVKRSR